MESPKIIEPDCIRICLFSSLMKFLVKLLKTKSSGQGFLSEIFLGLWQAGRLHLVVLLVAGALAPL